MNKTIHENLVSAAVATIRRADTANQDTEWITVLRTVHGDMSRQSDQVLGSTMFEALRNFQEHLNYDEWASAWRINQLSGSGCMKVDPKTGKPMFLFFVTATEGPHAHATSGFEPFLENRAFSTSHEAMLLKYKHYKNDLLGDLNFVGSGSPASELSELTSGFLKSFKIFMGSYIIERFARELAGLTVKTFLEYIAFLIEETNFTMPIMRPEWRPTRAPNPHHMPPSGLEKYQTTKKCMTDINYPKIFNDEKYGSTDETETIVATEDTEAIVATQFTDINDILSSMTPSQARLRFS